MNEINDLGELRKIAKAYSKNKTFVFVEEVVSGRSAFYNGYVLSVKEDLIVFFDKILNKEFPIILETIRLIKPSKKEEDGRKQD